MKKAKTKVIWVVSLLAFIAGVSYAEDYNSHVYCGSTTVNAVGTATPPSKHATAKLMCGTTEKTLNLFPPNGGNSAYNFELLKNALSNGFKVDVCYNPKKGDTITSVQILAPPEGVTGTTGCFDENKQLVEVTGVIETRKNETDQAQFKLKHVTDIKTAAEVCAPVVFRFGASCDSLIYELIADQVEVTALNLRYKVGNVDVVRCVFNSEECVVNLKNLEFDNEALDVLLPGDMTVCLEVGGTRYCNTGYWTQENAGNGNSTKYRKDN